MGDGGKVLLPVCSVFGGARQRRPIGLPHRQCSMLQHGREQAAQFVLGHGAALNIGTVVRTANAFAVHTVHIVGRHFSRFKNLYNHYSRLC